MPECAELRPLLLTHFDGECPVGDSTRVEAHLRSCEDCGVRWDLASLEVGLFLMADPAAPEGAEAGPGAAFTARVMDRVAREPREPAPTPRLRLEPPPLARRWAVWAGVGGGAVAAAAALFLYIQREPSSRPETGGTAAFARGGGVLRWTSDFGRTIAGSTWITEGGSSPTLPGDLLHSPAPSSARVRLPEGGRLDAGPSSWLAVGGSGEAALLEGGITGSADGTKVLTLHTPSGEITSGGELEVSIRSAAGESRAKGLAWLGAWAASRRADAAPAAPLPAPPGAVMVVYAKRGPARVVLGGGPVRNSLERQVMLKAGQALVILESKTFVVDGVEDDAPADSARWTDGMPVPPGSTVFHDAPAPASPGPGPIGTAAGPVRNSLEIVLSDPVSDPAARAYALSVYDGVGGAEAVAAAARAAADPAVLVRSAAVRILAMNAWAARDEALAALRRLALDKDAGVARFAILGLKALEDRGAVPTLQSIVQDGRPVEYPAIVAKVYAFDALVALGDPSLVANAAALAPAAEYDAELARVLQQGVFDAFDALPRSEPRKYVEDPRPSVRAAAILALADLDVAQAALTSPVERVRIAGAKVLFKALGSKALDDLGTVTWDSPASRTAVLQASFPLFRNEPTLPVPPWLAEVARDSLDNKVTPQLEASECIFVLSRAGVSAPFEEVLVTGTVEQRLATLRWVPVLIGSTVPLLGDRDPTVREEALNALRRASQRSPSEADMAALLGNLSAFSPSSYKEARAKASVLTALARGEAAVDAHGALIEMARSASIFNRQASATFLGASGRDESSARTVVALLADPDRETAERAAETLYNAILGNRWGGPAAESLFHSSSPFPGVRILVAMAAQSAGVPGALEAVHAGMSEASSRVRLRVLTALRNTGRRLSSLGSAVYGDPSPEVRLMALQLAEEEEARDGARRLASDPYIWVRGSALGVLAKAGEADSVTALRELLPTLRGEPGAGGKFLRLVSPDDPELPDKVSAAAMMEMASGRIGQSVATGDAGLANVLRVLWTRSQIAAASSSLHDSREATRRVDAARRLAVLPGTGAAEALLRALDEAREPDPVVRAAAAESLGRLIGFTPAEGWSRFEKDHSGGTLYPRKIRSREVR